MQTFLPYPSFAASAAVLDGPRLGKQRVETLQILRALLVPTYGWQRHPAVSMWRGHVAGLTAYGLAMTDAWTGRGYADTVRNQILEFAPEVDGRAQDELGPLLPAWLGDAALHESHRSRLIAKDPAFYRPLFPDTPEGLDPVWPVAPAPASAPIPDPLWIVRAEEPSAWLDAGLVGMPDTNPNGKVTPAWRAQLAHLADDLEPGTLVALLGEDGRRLHLGRVTGPLAGVTVDGAAHAARAVAFRGDLDRSDLPVPAQLQNPRRIFPVRLAPIAG